MSITSRQRYELKKFIKELEQYKGRGTELVTVYIPAGYDINKILTHLSQEQGTATNIKSTSTRKNVIDALERMIQHLKLYPKTPENGLAVFSGNVAEREGQSDVKVWALEPPVPINTRIYRCDKEFLLDLMRDLVEVKEGYGLVVMDRREGTVAMLKGKQIIELSSATSNVPGKTRAGGQSAARYMRIREDAAKDFYKKVAAMMQDAFLGNDEIKGIIVGGPGPSKHDLIDKGYINQEIKKKIIGIKDLSYTGSFGVQALVDKSDDVLGEEEIAEEKRIMAKFFELLRTNPGLVAYGEAEVKRNLEIGAVETLLVSEEYTEEGIEAFEQTVEQFGSDLKIISTETREGVQLREIGKVAAILRFDASV